LLQKIWILNHCKKLTSTDSSITSGEEIIIELNFNSILNF
jgi:hypothetical protein